MRSEKRSGPTMGTLDMNWNQYRVLEYFLTTAPSLATNILLTSPDFCGWSPSIYSRVLFQQQKKQKNRRRNTVREDLRGHQVVAASSLFSDLEAPPPRRPSNFCVTTTSTWTLFWRRLSTKFN